MINTNDILIAEFMNVEVEDGLYMFSTPMDDYKTDTLYFDCSWDWLMPVVEKIYSIDADIDFFKNISLKDTYQAVVEFIREHNEEVE